MMKQYLGNQGAITILDIQTHVAGDQGVLPVPQENTLTLIRVHIDALYRQPGGCCLLHPAVGVLLLPTR